VSRQFHAQVDLHPSELPSSYGHVSFR